jgi:YD repeat-containing protein
MQSASGQTGAEGFLAISPDGTKYRFDWMAIRNTSPLEKANRNAQQLAAVTSAADMSVPPPAPLSEVADGFWLDRSEVWILPTLVTDRFGATVIYTYDPANPWQLKTIQSSDGAKLTLTWTGNRVTSITDTVRTWRYEYVGNVLSRVVQPDNSAWELSQLYEFQRPIAYADGGECDTLGIVNETSRTATIQHPSGASGTFVLNPTTFGRSYVPRVCVSGAPTTAKPYAYYPRYFDSLALQSKTLSGPGLATLTWRYFFGSPNASWDSECSAGCAETRIVNVAEPDNNVTRYTFGNRFRETEGKLLKVESGLTDLTAESGGTPLRVVDMRYRSPNAASTPYPNPVGTSLQARGEGGMASSLSPLDQKVTTQQGATFTWQVDPARGDFDSFGRPITIVRSSSLGFSRAETTAYHDNSTRWVIGQIASITDPDNGKQPVSKTYQTNDALLQSDRLFGHLERTYAYTWNLLNTARDANGNSTFLTSYKLGLPQQVNYNPVYPDRYTVNDIGLPTSHTDVFGSITQYAYDAMGRLSQVTYPAADTVAWLPTTYAFEQVASTEFGLDANHWRQTVATGDARTIHYFDALWRPVMTRTFDAADEANTRKVTIRRFDFNGRKVFESYPQRDIASYLSEVDGIASVYDALGRTVEVREDSEQGQLITGYSYENGFARVITNPRGKSTRTEFFAQDEPIEKLPVRVLLPTDVEVLISRDSYGKPKSITRSGNGASATRSYVYDQYERLCKTIEPEAGATILAYDAANNISWRAEGQNAPDLNDCGVASVPAAKKISYTYDYGDRVLRVTPGDGSPIIVNAYTADGLLSSSSTGTLLTNTYNKRRMLESESAELGTGKVDLVRTYTPNGYLASLRYPSDNLTVQYNPNALGEPRQVGSYAANITYHPNGSIAGFTYGNGIAHAMTQNRRGLPDQTTDNAVLSDRYSYDANGNVGSITDLQESIGSRTMLYDDLDRLTGVDAPALWSSATYGYDALDNL